MESNLYITPDTMLLGRMVRDENGRNALRLRVPAPRTNIAIVANRNRETGFPSGSAAADVGPTGRFEGFISSEDNLIGSNGSGTKRMQNAPLKKCCPK